MSGEADANRRIAEEVLKLIQDKMCQTPFGDRHLDAEEVLKLV
jgi:hypothetical protein